MLRVMVIAGEASGDLHAGKIITAVKQLRTDIHFYGIGGERMRQAGADVMVDCKEMAVVGLVEIWAHRKVIFGALDTMRDEISHNPPDLLLLVDYPEFNLRLAKHAKAQGVKVLFYISPQIWAWRQYRVKKIKQLVDMMAVIFPFEEAFYLKHGVPVRFVGHPLLNEIKVSQSRDTLLTAQELDPDKPVIGLLPGSRRGEIKRLLGIILESARLTRTQIPDAQFLLPLADSLELSELQNRLNDYPELGIRVVQGQTYNVINSCDVVLTVSGTVTLEIALLHTPMIIINKVAWLTYVLVNRLLKIDHIGLCNIVADKRIAPEFIQHDATPEKISLQLIELLQCPEKRQQMSEQLAGIESRLGSHGGIQNMAQLIIEMLPAEAR